MRRGRHARQRGSAKLWLSVALGLVFVLGGTAFAAYRYDAANADRVLPGVRVAGIDVGGMTRDEALAAVDAAADEVLRRPIEVRASDGSWIVTPEELGTTADVVAKVDAALGIGEQLPWTTRVFHRLAGDGVDRDLELRFEPDRAQVDRFVDVIAGSVRVSPVNADVRLVDGEIVLTKPREGRSLRAKAARSALLEGMAGGAGSIDLALRSTRPKVTAKELGHTIVVRLSENRLYLYKGLKRVKTYRVATGQPGFPTPQGEFEIIHKMANPSWTNPAPDGWGAGMPAVIPPGPSNPLGTRALYLNSPGIRIHGTSADSSIGTYASHGCIRMHRWDVEQLFEIVPVGTQVLIVW